MTQSPQSGQTAPRSTDFGSASRHGAPNDAPEAPGGPAGQSAWGSSSNQPPAQHPAFGAPVHADAPTGSMPLVSGSTFGPPNSPPPPPPPPTPTSASAPTSSVPNLPPVGPAESKPTSATASASQPRTRATRARGPRRARLQLRNINPWTVLKFSCVLSIALFFVWLIVIGVLFGVLDAAGIIGKINDAVVQLNGPGSKPPVTASLIFGGAAIIGVVNIVLFVALSTVGSVVYNLCADLVGGIEITLSER
ncbi:MAG: DUF3566 domain-containing protein [Jatrophihabitans sp.]